MAFLSIPEIIGGLRLAKPFNDNFNAIQAWANGNIGDANLANDSVGGNQVKGSAIALRHLSDDSVGTAQLVDYAVTPKHLAKTGFTWGYKSATNSNFAPPVASTLYLMQSLGTITPEFDCTLLTNYHIAYRRRAGVSVAELNAAICNNETALFTSQPSIVAVAENSSAFASLSTAIPLTANVTYTLSVRLKSIVGGQTFDVTTQGYSLILPR